MTLVKFCGFTRPEDAAEAVRLGVDAIGLNFHPESPRCVSVEKAREIVRGLEGTRVVKVGVFVDATEEDIRRIAVAVGLDQFQLHGEESPQLARQLAPHAYKAFRVRDETVLTRIRFYPHELFLLDAWSPEALGGTGKTFRWDIADRARELGRVILAGGLTPANVGRAIREAQPDMVDAAGGIESAPGIKDAMKMAAFIEAVRSADRTGGTSRVDGS